MTGFLEIISLPSQSKNSVSSLWGGTINTHITDCTSCPAPALPGGSSPVPTASMYTPLNTRTDPINITWPCSPGATWHLNLEHPDFHSPARAVKKLFTSVVLPWISFLPAASFCCKEPHAASSLFTAVLYLSNRPDVFCKPSSKVSLGLNYYKSGTHLVCNVIYSSKKGFSEQSNSLLVCAHYTLSHQAGDEKKIIIIKNPDLLHRRNACLLQQMRW